MRPDETHDDEDNDARLLRRYAEEREQAAFAELVRRHVDGVYSAALRRLGGDVQLAQDVAQEVFIALAREAKRLSRHPVLSGWLYTTTRNLAANIVRAERRRKSREEKGELMNEHLGPATVQADWTRLAPLLENAMDQLSDADRLAVLLRFIDRKSFGEIGHVLSLTEEAARKRVERALEKLRLLLVRRGIASTATALGVALTSHAVGAAPVGLVTTVTSAALAASVATASPMAAILGFMSTTKGVISTAALAGLIAAFGTAGFEWKQRREAERSLSLESAKEAQVLANRLALKAKVSSADADLAQLNKSIEDTRAAIEAAKVAAATKRGKDSKAAGADKWDPEKEGRAFLERHPDAKRALAARARGVIQNDYGAFFKMLNLTPAQIDQFVAIYSGDYGSLGTTMFDGKFINFPVDTGIAPDQVERALRDLLGNEGREKYREFRVLKQDRDLTTQVASQLAFTASPLSTEQADKLVQILAGNRVNLRGTPLSPIDWEAAVREANQILDQTQQAALLSMRAVEDLKTASFKAQNTSNVSVK